MINGRTDRRVGIKGTYCKLVQLQLNYEVRAARAITCRLHKRNVCVPALGHTSIGGFRIDG